MVINNPEWLELTKEVESFMNMNGLIMSNQTNPSIVDPQSTVTTPHVAGDWTTSNSPPSKTRTHTNSATEVNTKARAVLISRQNSHPFQTRTLLLEPSQEVKVGRSLARNRVSENNAIFDCKVLSRNHAVIWYSDGKFFIKDTGSSNGTFINNQRLSQGSAPSNPFEVCSNDIVQFGVDVTENSRKETHGCIVATLKLYLPDGRETKASPHSNIGVCPSSIPPEDLCRLNQYIQEAVEREHILESKLLKLQKIVELTRKNSSSNWQAMIDEDRLLSRIDLLENKLQCFQKNSAEDKIREDILKLQEDKSDYQNSAKEALRRVYQERSEALQKLTTMERALCSSDDECLLLRDQLDKSQQSLQEITARLSHMESNFTSFKEKVEQDKIQEESEAMFNSQLKYNHAVEINELNKKLDILLKEKEELLSRVALYQYCENLTNEEEDDTETLNKVKKMLTNVELNDKSLDENEDENESCKLTNNLPDIDNLFLKENLIEDRLNALKKKLFILESKLKVPYEADSDNVEVISDGNQNVDHLNTDIIESNNIIKEVIKLSWLIYMELKARINLSKLNDNGKLPTEVEEKYNIRINELETMLSKKSFESENSLDMDVSSNENEQKSKTNTDEVMLLNMEIEELRSKITEMEMSNKMLQSEFAKYEPKTEKIDIGLQIGEEKELINVDSIVNMKVSQSLSSANSLSISSSTLSFNTNDIEDADISIEDNKNLSTDDENLYSDLIILNDPKVQNEEELIIFKEKFNDLTNENLKLKEDIIILKASYDQLKHKSIINLLMYLSPIIVLIAYLFISYS